MADDTTPDPGTTTSNGDDRPTDLLPEPAASAAPRRRRVLALWGVLAVLAVGAGAVVVRSRDDNPPRLPIALGASVGESTKSAAGSSAPVGPATDMAMLRPVTYVAGDDLPLLGGSGAAYRLRGGVTEDQVRTLAKAFGLTATPTREGTHWSVQGDSGRLDVDDGGGGMWWYSSGAAMGGAGDSGSGSVSSSGGGTASPPGAILVAPVAPDAPVPGVTTTVVGPSSPEQAIALCPPDAKCAEPVPFVPPADLPTEADARTKALDLLRSVGADVDHADVHVDGPYEAWYITVEPRIDGLVASGLSYSVQVGPKGVISGAGGTLAHPERLGDYPVLDTRKAIDRLNTQFAVPMGAPEDLAARDGLASTTAPAAPAATIEPNTTVSTDTACDKVAPPPDGSTGITTMEACVGGGPTTPTEPYVPPEPQTIVLHGAERILMLVPASDGSTDAYLVPGYRFTGDQETVIDQIAVDDASLVPQQARVPMQVDPAVGETKPGQ
jgi:hypothetical protein